MSDTPFLKRILLACSTGANRLFRNNIGVGWVGKAIKITARQTITVNAGDVVIRQARPLHAGLHVGAGDLIGYHSFVIQPEDVGRRIAQLVSLEAKEGTGRLSPDQRQWLTQLQAAGAIAAEVRSVDDARLALSGLQPVDPA